MDTPFGWWIEAGDLRWFTREASRVNEWRSRKGAKVVALGVIVESLPEPEPLEETPIMCLHEPDVMKRCVKCGMNLNI
jgi:hypothetical protein